MAQIKWKTKAKIEEEKNKPKEPTLEERLQALEMMELERLLGGI